jgi:hypothetical protein
MLLLWLLSQSRVASVRALDQPATCPVAADSAYAFDGLSLDGCEYSLGESARKEPYWTIRSASIVISECTFSDFKTQTTEGIHGYALYLAVENDIIIRDSKFEKFTHSGSESSVIYVQKAVDVDLIGLHFSTINSNLQLVKTGPPPRPMIPFFVSSLSPISTRRAAMWPTARALS